MKRAIVFDFDGTLVDSADSILEGFRHILDRRGIEPVRAIDSSVIGPPLLATLGDISGIADKTVLERMAAEFKAYYDTEGYRQTRPYPGIPDVLATLHRRGEAIFLATNKRNRPTHLILEHLGWAGYFSGVHCLDDTVPPLADKAALLSRFLASRQLLPGLAVYIGDTVADLHAAQENGMTFVRAEWGYGLWPATPDTTPLSCATPAELGTVLTEPESMADSGHRALR